MTFIKIFVYLFRSCYSFVCKNTVYQNGRRRSGSAGGKVVVKINLQRGNFIRLCCCEKKRRLLLNFAVYSLQIPVFLSQALSQNLYIYQYPVRPANRDWKDVKVVNASVKPRNKMVRLEVGLDTYSDKYCSSKGEQIALNTDGHQV